MQAADVQSESASFLAVTTLVIWTLSAAVGVIGLKFPYARPQPIAKAPEPIQAEVLKVDLTPQPLSPPANEPVRQDRVPPPELQPISPPKAPPLIAVAQPNPAIAFALPIEGPSRVVPAKEASFATPAPAVVEPAHVPTPQTQQLTFGEGEGKQPAPEYPRRAMAAGQEGTVLVRFSVGEDGRVLTAQASAPCLWALLNDSAVRVVRERWRFRAGPARLYQVSIRFELRK
jgi:TonB family protein